MASITAVEIGADTCALASTSVHGMDVRVAAADTLDPASFPGIDAFTLALEQTRRSLKLPRRCRAIVWGLPDGATRNDPMVGPLIEPLIRAGFRVARVVTPCNALGALARLRTSRNGGAMCWLGINRSGVAIVVIRPGSLLYSHSFAWDSSVGATGSQARLLQRYSLVAFLAPEVRRAFAAAKQKGTTVDGIVTCGNLPDLRALTMPLIEELDIEVETLDSLEGLVVKPELADKLADIAPAIRLACAGALARETRIVDASRRRRVSRASRVSLLGAAGAIALVAGGAYWWYGPSRRPAPEPFAPRTAVKNTAVKNTSTPPVTQSVPAAKPPVTTPANTSRTPQAASSTPLPAATKSTTAPAPRPANPVPPRPQAASTVAAKNPPAQAPKTAPPPRPTPTNVPSPAPKPAPAAPPAAAPVNTPAAAADKPQGAPTARSSARPPELLKDPVPKVTAILVAADRRLATVGDEGRIIAVGDTVGRRVVVAIDDRTVLLREPSGVQIRVALGGRLVGVERPDR